MTDINLETQNKEYFANRRVSPEYMDDFTIPNFLLPLLPKNKEAAILDIGPGFGHTLKALRSLGYTNISGIDISDESVSYCQKIGLNVRRISSLDDFFSQNKSKYEMVVMTHVIEHIQKDKIIKTLQEVKQLMTENGFLYLTTPNAQSNTGSYWMFEDFTHTTIFTSGSMIYVLKAAGFNSIDFIDPADLRRHGFVGKMIKRSLLGIYRLNKKFWNSVTASSYHKPSPEIYSFELKVMAK